MTTTPVAVSPYRRRSSTRFPPVRDLVERPKDDDWLQQRFASYQPVPTIRSLILLLFTLTPISAGFTALFWKRHENVFEVRKPYSGDGSGESTEISFTINDDLSGPFRLYYELDGFYMNGKCMSRVPDNTPFFDTDVCKRDWSVNFPFDSSGYCTQPCDGACTTADGRTSYSPCGILSAVMFNDVIALLGPDGRVVKTSQEKIFREHGGCEGVLHEMDPVASFYRGLTKSCTNGDPNSWLNAVATICKRQNENEKEGAKFVKPAGWAVELCGKGEKRDATLSRLIELAVWYDVAPFSRFRKPYRDLEVDKLAKGTYTFNITNNYKISWPGGKKAVVLTNANPPLSKAQTNVLRWLLFGYTIFLLSMTIILIAVDKFMSVRGGDDSN